MDEEERELATELYDRNFMNNDLLFYKIGGNGKPIYIRNKEESVRNEI